MLARRGADGLVSILGGDARTDESHAMALLRTTHDQIGILVGLSGRIPFYFERGPLGIADDGSFRQEFFYWMGVHDVRRMARSAGRTYSDVIITPSTYAAEGYVRNHRDVLEEFWGFREISERDEDRERSAILFDLTGDPEI